MMRISLPLAGMDGTTERKAPSAFDEDRAFRMLSEGELFYVDPSSDTQDMQNSTRHDHGHLGGVSLEVITRAMAAGEILKLKPESEGGDTEAVSRSSSQDTDTLEQQPQPGVGHADPASALIRRASLGEPHDREWDFSNLAEAECPERGYREKSFSEPQLRHPIHHCRNGSGRAQQKSVDMDDLLLGPWSKQPGRMAAVSEGFATAREPARHRDGDVCTAAKNAVERLWAAVLGQEFGRRRVEFMSRNWGSSTSSKTFEGFEGDREALARLGAVPDTYTMHIARFSVVSTIIGHHAEFEVLVKGGGRRWSKWHRFSSFKLMATCVEADPSCARAWKRLLLAQPCRRCLDKDYLAHKCYLLEGFLQQVLFAMPTPALLIHFVSGSS